MLSVPLVSHQVFQLAVPRTFCLPAYTAHYRQAVVASSRGRSLLLAVFVVVLTVDCFGDSGPHTNKW